MGLLIGVGSTKPTFPYDYYYGIEWDITVGNPIPTRIGKAELHKTLPVHSKIRRCLLNDDGTVNYYLHPNDSDLRDTGIPADLSGADGQFMVELPEMYVRFEQDGNKCRAMISDQPLPGFIKWGREYVSAVEATVHRPTNKLSSVVNSAPEYRGGNNNANNDGNENTFLNRPATAISLTNFRAYARKRGVRWNCMTYQMHRRLWWLFAIEYCNFNSQANFNPELTVEGYHQGGLGMGVTTLDGGKWNTFNGYYPFIPNEHTLPLGNKTGIEPYQMPSSYSTTQFVVNVPSYRGVVNPFGHLWQWTDGVLVEIQSNTDGGMSKVYVCDDPDKFADTPGDGYQYRGNIPRQEGYVKALMMGEHGDIMPNSLGGSTTQYFCDYFYTNIPTSGKAIRGVLFGGHANNGAAAGFVSASTYSTPSTSYANVGSRLCFIPIE